MITPKQIRAARAILGWSQQELADAVGLSKQTIIDAEREGHQARAETLGRISQVLEDAGLEFLTGGVRERVDIVSIYEGEDCGIRLLRQAYSELQGKSEQILFYGASEDRANEEIIDEAKKIKAAGIDMRLLIRNNDTHIMGDLSDYRWMPDKLWLDSDAKTIFGDKVAYAVTWQNKPKIICFRDRKIAEIEKKIFNFVWEISARPTHSTSKTRY